MKSKEIIPNIDGYRLAVWVSDGKVVETKVVKGLDGLHRVDGIEIKDIIGWSTLAELTWIKWCLR